jgi:hypothetical protein
VRTDVADSIPSEIVEHLAPPLPCPHQIQVLQSSNASYTVYWRENSDLVNIHG